MSTSHEKGDAHAPRAYRAIINLYRPGESIVPHVSQLRRFRYGIVGVSLGDSGVSYAVCVSAS